MRNFFLAVRDTVKAQLIFSSSRKDGTTPLMIASAAGHADCCRELIRQGANPAMSRKVIDSNHPSIWPPP